jgi:SAM-dependent methyltransferase
MRWRVNRRVRARFASVVEGNSPADDAVFLDVGSGILGGHNASGLSTFIIERTVALEIDTVSGIGVAADAHDLPWRSNAIDGVLIQGVLEHVERPERVVAEILRVLKPGAPVIAEVPFLQHYHLDPLDFKRWTSYGFDQLFANFDRVDSGVCAGPASALTDMLTEFPALLFSAPGPYWAAKTAVGWLVSPLQLLDAVWSTRPRAHVAAGAVYYLGVKPRAAA